MWLSKLGQQKSIDHALCLLPRGQMEFDIEDQDQRKSKSKHNTLFECSYHGRPRYIDAQIVRATIDSIEHTDQTYLQSKNT